MQSRSELRLWRARSSNKFQCVILAGAQQRVEGVRTRATGSWSCCFANAIHGKRFFPRPLPFAENLFASRLAACFRLLAAFRKLRWKHEETQVER